MVFITSLKHVLHFLLKITLKNHLNLATVHFQLAMHEISLFEMICLQHLHRAGEHPSPVHFVRGTEKEGSLPSSSADTTQSLRLLLLFLHVICLFYTKGDWQGWHPMAALPFSFWVLRVGNSKFSNRDFINEQVQKRKPVALTGIYSRFHCNLEVLTSLLVF